jgi:hypothetical protein
MNQATGQALRLTGLLIELLGAIAVVLQSRGTSIASVPLPGGASVSLGWLAVAVGFALFLTGRIILVITAPPKGKLRKSPTDDEADR